MPIRLYELFLKFPRIIVAHGISPSSFKLKWGILPLLSQNIKQIFLGNESSQELIPSKIYSLLVYGLKVYGL